MTVINPSRPHFYTVDGGAAKNQFTIVAGGGAWIDTDITTSDVPLAASIIFMVANPAANQSTGAKRHGDTQTFQWASQSGYSKPLETGQDSTGHVDLYRNAANIVYYITGYMI